MCCIFLLQNLDLELSSSVAIHFPGVKTDDIVLQKHKSSF